MPFKSSGEIRKCKWCDKPAKKYYQGTRFKGYHRTCGSEECLKAQETGKVVELCCAIGDDTIDGKPYSEIVEIARKYIQNIGGFEKFAEWGLY